MAAVITGPASALGGALVARYFGQSDKGEDQRWKAMEEQLHYLRNEIDRLGERLERNSSRIAGITAVLRFIHPELRNPDSLSGDR